MLPKSGSFEPSTIRVKSGLLQGDKRDKRPFTSHHTAEKVTAMRFFDLSDKYRKPRYFFSNVPV